MAHDVFLSYSSKDKPIADAVCGALEGKRIRCWIAPRDVLPGLSYGRAIIEVIEASRVMVLLFSASANSSDQVMREVERAVSKGIPIIPLRIEDVLPSKSLEYFLGTPHWLDALTPPLWKHLQYLAETVHVLLDRQGQRGDSDERETAPSRRRVVEDTAKPAPPPSLKNQPQPAAPQVKQPTTTVRATPADMPERAPSPPQDVPPSQPMIQKTNKTAHLNWSRKWLTVSLAVVLLIGLLGLIIGVSLSNHSPSPATVTKAATSIDKKPAPKAAPTVTKSNGKKPAPNAAPTVTKSSRMQLVLVNPGVFLMGSPANEIGRGDDERQHEVEITRPFYVSVHEVTQEQYESVMGKNPSWFSRTGGGRDKVKGMDTRQLPVESVSWEDAVEFCRQLSEQPEEKANERRYRLPTEAEWEYVCRGGPLFKKPSRTFYFGNSLSSAQANFNGNYPYGRAAKGVYLGHPTTVGSYPANPLGLYDLHGNVLEWCTDWYDADYYKRSPRQDPQGPENGKRHVLRGGSWDNAGQWCRASFRGNYPPNSSSSLLGFRVVLVVGARN